MDSRETSVVENCFTEYYTALVECILNDQKELFSYILKDISQNGKISPTLPYMVNFLTATNLVSHDLGKLSWMLYVINAFFDNPLISLDNYLMPLLKSVMYCVFEPLAASINPLNDHWILRDYGSRLLVKIVYVYPPCTDFLLEHLHDNIKQILSDPTRPLCSHYGAIMTIGTLGFETLKTLFLPNLSRYIAEVVEPFLTDLSLTNVHLKEDAHKVFGAIKGCIEQHCPAPSQISPDSTVDMEVFHDIKELFGESLTGWMRHSCPSENKENATSSQSSPQFLFQYKINVDTPHQHVREYPSSKQVFENQKLVTRKDIVIQFGHPRQPKRKRYEGNCDNDSFCTSHPSWNFCLLKMHASRPLHSCNTTEWCL